MEVVPVRACREGLKDGSANSSSRDPDSSPLPPLRSLDRGGASVDLTGDVEGEVLAPGLVAMTATESGSKEPLERGSGRPPGNIPGPWWRAGTRLETDETSLEEMSRRD